MENKYTYFLASKFLGGSSFFVLVYSDQDGNAKRFKARRYYLPKGVVKNQNATINGKTFYDQPSDSDIKR